MTSFHRLLRSLGFRTYRGYLRSDHWRAFRTAYKRSERPQYCLGCGVNWFQLHHICYDRLGNERLTDIIPLCRWCHKAVHRITRRYHLELWQYNKAIQILRRK